MGSWYNNINEITFTDATQKLEGGIDESLEDINSDISTINASITDITDVFKAKVLNIQNGSLDTIIVNDTANSRIFLQNNNSEPKIKVEGGKLYLYYDYDFTNAPTIPAGWTDILAYAIANRQTLLVQAVDLLAIDTYLFSPLPLNLPAKLIAIDEEILLNSGLIASLQTRTFNLEGEVAQLIARYYFQRGGAVMPDNTDGITNMAEAMSTVRERLRVSRQDYINFCNSLTGDIAGQAGQQAVANLSRSTLEIVSAGGAFAYQLFQNIFIGFGIAGVALTWWYLDSQKDRINIEKEAKLIITYEKLLTNENSNNIDTIHLAGLAIYAGNNLLGNDGTYAPTISNGGKLEIKIINGSAVITSVIDIGTPTLTVGQIISIPKTALGGVNTGTLDIQITSLISARQSIRDALEATKIEKETIQNRRRLREGVINTSELGDGLSVVYNSTLTNAETGEVLQVPTIKLNLNSAQLETINGVLNIKKYVNQDDIDIINGNINVIDGEIVDINQSLERVYKVILPIGATMTSDYKLNLGYKETFLGFPYDLIMLATYKGSYTTWTASHYNNDFLGYFPNMSRLALTGDAKVIYTAGLLVNSTEHFSKGFIWIKNSNELKVFNLNRKFEFVCFLKFSSFNNNSTDYHLLQGGVDLGQGFIEIDYTRLNVFIRNRKLVITHPAVVAYQQYTTSPVNHFTTYLVNNNYTVGNIGNYAIVLQAELFGSSVWRFLWTMYNKGYILTHNIYQNALVVLNKANNPDINSDYRHLMIYRSNADAGVPMANSTTPSFAYRIGKKLDGSFPTLQQEGLPYIRRLTLRFDILFTRMTSSTDNNPTLHQYDYATTAEKLDFTFRIRYVRGAEVNAWFWEEHYFTMADVNPTLTTTGTTYNSKWPSGAFGSNDPIIFPKRYWTYSFDFTESYPIGGKKVKEIEIYFPPVPNAPLEFATTGEKRYNYHPTLYLFDWTLETWNETMTETVETTYNSYSTTDTQTGLNNVSSTNFSLMTLQLDLPNNNINYYINQTPYTLTARPIVSLNTYNMTLPPHFPSTMELTASFVRWGNLTQDYSTIVVGNLPSTGSVPFSHFNWRYFQSNESFLTLTEIQKLMTLIQYNYYNDYVKIDKHLNANEITASSGTFNKLTVNGFPITEIADSTRRSTSLRTDGTQDYEIGNVLVEIGNLYIDNPTVSGVLTYDYGIRRFVINQSGGVVRSVEDAIIKGFIEESAGTGLVWNSIDETLNVVQASVDTTAIYSTIESSNLNVSNYVRATSNFLQEKINAIPPPTAPYNLPFASASQLGGVKIGSGLNMNAVTGVLSVPTNTFIPIATETGLGNVIIGNGINVDFDGKISLKTASATQLGGIKVGNNLNIDADGILSASVPATSGGSKWTANAGTIYATDLGSNVVIGQVQTGTTGSKFKVYPNSGQNACFFNGSVALGSASSTSLFWNNNNDTFIGRANTIGSYSSSSIVGDVIISSDKNIIIKSGTSTVTPSIYVKQTDGNVGIGKINPLYKLDVGGNINCASLYFNGSLYTPQNYVLPPAGLGINGVLGGVKYDGTSISVDANGVLRTVNTYNSYQIQELIDNTCNYVATTCNYLRDEINTIDKKNWINNNGTVYVANTGCNLVVGAVQFGTSGSKFKVYPNEGQNAGFFNGSVSLRADANSSYFWTTTTDTYLGRASAVGAYSSSSIVGDLILSGNNNIIIKSGTSTATPSIYVKQTDGNVGIGKNNPSYKLDVSGTINCSEILVNGSAIPIYNETALTTLVNTKDANVSNYVRATSNYLKGAIDGIPIYDDTALTTLVNTNDTNVSNYVRATSNYLKGAIDGIPIYDDTALTTLVNTNDTNVSNYVRATSNYLKGAIDAIPIYDDTALTSLVNTNDTNVSNYVRTTSNYLKSAIDGIPIYDDTALTTLVNSNDSNVSNYVRTTSNYLKSAIDGIPIYDDTALTTLVNSNDSNVSNYVRTTSNYLKGAIDAIPIYDDTALTTLVNSNDSNVSNYVRATSNYLKGAIDAIPIYNDTALTALVNTKDANVSNYVRATSNYLKGAIDAIVLTGGGYDDTALTALVNSNDSNVSNYVRTTSNILFNDFVARDAVLNTKINTNDLNISNYVRTTSNILQTSINTNAYSDTKVSTYLGTTATKVFGGKIGVGLSDPVRNLHIHSTTAAQIGIQMTDGSSGALSNNGYNIWKSTDGSGNLFNYGVKSIYIGLNTSIRIAVLYNSWTEFSGMASATITGLRYGSSSVTWGSSLSSGLFTTVVVKTNGSIWSTGSLVTSSSRLIKKEIEELEDQECLNKLLRLKPVKYRYIDNLKNRHATNKVYGFIAEEVKEVLPEAVQNNTEELIPNIYTQGRIENNILIIDKELELNVEYTCYLEYAEDDEIKITPLGVYSESGRYIIDKTYENGVNILVYGKRIKDFHTLDKAHFHALTVSSCQELYKIIMDQKQEITDLKERMARLEAYIN
jgi:hypothetical protein